MPHLASLRLEPSPLNITDWVVDPLAGELSRPPGVPARTGVCIYGAGYGKEHAPLEDRRWEVWALNVIPPIDSAGRLRADRWFEMHQRHAQSEQDMAWIAKCPCPIYVPPDLMAASANAVPYPLGEIEALFRGGYWACTFAYQIALALAEGVRTIGLFGVELAWGTERERTLEFACVSWWMGLAEGRGVRVVVPPGSRLGKHPHRYGLEYDAEKEDTDLYVEAMRRDAGTGAGG